MGRNSEYSVTIRRLARRPRLQGLYDLLRPFSLVVFHYQPIELQRPVRVENAQLAKKLLFRDDPCHENMVNRESDPGQLRPCLRGFRSTTPSIGPSRNALI